jgi:hypothetical protein
MKKKRAATNYEMNKWYDRQHMPYTADHNTAQDYADWINQIPWKLFCTFTFAWRVSDVQADKTFHEFINRLEHYLKCDVGYVRGDEKRFSGCGKPASGRHYHVLLTAAAPINPIYVELLWMSMAGTRQDLGGAKVDCYQAQLNGPSYVMKMINHVHGDWGFRNLHLFHPKITLEKPDRRMRRHLRRHQARKILLASAMPTGEGTFLTPYFL